MSTLHQKEISICPVHSFCTSQGIKILKNDHFLGIAAHLDSFLLLLEEIA